MNFKEKAKADLQGNWTIQIIAVIAMLALYYFTNGILYLLGSGIVLYAYVGINMKMVCKQPVRYENFIDGFKRWDTNLVAGLLVWLWTFLWSLLFIIPGIIKRLSLSQTFYILNDKSNLSADEAMKQSERMMEGNKSRLFSLYLSFLGWFILSGLTFGLLLVYVLPYLQMTLTHFYFDLREKQKSNYKHE